MMKTALQTTEPVSDPCPTASSPPKKVRVSGPRLGSWFRNWLQMPAFQDLPKSNEGYPPVVVAANTGLPSIGACGTYLQPLLDRFLGSVVQINGKLWIAQAIDAKSIFYGHSRASVRPTNFDINGVLSRRTWSTQHCSQKYLEQHPPTTEKTGVAHWQFIEVDESALNHPIWHSNALAPHVAPDAPDLPSSSTTLLPSYDWPCYTYPYRIDDNWVEVPNHVAQKLRTIAYKEWGRLQSCPQSPPVFSQAWWVENGPRIAYKLDTPGESGQFAFVAKDRNLREHSSSRIDAFASTEEDLVWALLNILEHWKQARDLAGAFSTQPNQPIWFYHSDATGKAFEPFFGGFPVLDVPVLTGSPGQTAFGSAPDPGRGTPPSGHNYAAHNPSAILRSVRPQLLPTTPALEALLTTTPSRKLSPSQWASLPPQLTSEVKASLYSAAPSGILYLDTLTPEQLPTTHWKHSQHNCPLTYQQTLELWVQKQLNALSC